LSVAHKSRPDYNNQELGTTKAPRTVSSTNLRFAGAQRKSPANCTVVPLALKPEYGESFSNHFFFLRAPLCARTEGSFVVKFSVSFVIAYISIFGLIKVLAVCHASRIRPQKKSAFSRFFTLQTAFVPLVRRTRGTRSPIIGDFLRYQMQKIYKCDRLLAACRICGSLRHQ
jgi:hypothetical protein